MENNFGGIIFFEGPNGLPLIRVNASEEFKAMSPLNQALYLTSAMQLAMICLQGLAHDNPKEAEQIMKMMGDNSLEMVPGPQLH